MAKQVCTSKKKIYRIDEPFPKIDNLEYFPEKVLLRIFAAVDDLDLLHLTYISNRFATIAQDVFKEIYADEYFYVHGEGEQDDYRDLISCFGSHITAIYLDRLKQLDESHWLIQLVNEHIKRLSKCYFFGCEFNSLLNTLAQQLNLSELLFQEVYLDDSEQLPEFRHLTNFEVNDSEFFPRLEYARVISNNPQLERLRICTVNVPVDIFAQVNTHLNYLIGLHIMNWEYSLCELIPISSAMEQRLEFLSLSVDGTSVDALRHISSRCRNIKELTLLIFDLPNEDLADAIRSFASMTKLILHIQNYMEKALPTITRGLPNLMFLFMRFYTFPPGAGILLKFLRECESLESISVNSNMNDINVEFHEKFLDIVRNRSKKVKIELLQKNQVITTITEEEIVHRNKLVHWIGWHPEHNHSNVYLLDLAKPKDSANEKWKQRPIESILNYLDINSLFAFHQTSSECQLLVEQFMEKRYQQDEKMFIATENQIDINTIQFFGQYVTNLKVTVVPVSSQFWKTINENCRYVTKLEVCENAEDDELIEAIINRLFYFPNVKHFEYSANNSTVDFDVSRLYLRQLSTLKFESNVRLINNLSRHNEFKDLQEIEFHTRNSSIDDFLSSLDDSAQRKITFGCTDYDVDQ